MCVVGTLSAQQAEEEPRAFPKDLLVSESLSLEEPLKDLEQHRRFKVV